MTTTDEWVTAALTDDAVVVELLFRLKQSSSPSSSSSSPPPPLRWGHRQPRSKPPPAAAASKKEPSRCSPTTPLSWSYGGGSADFSPAGDGSDESSRPSDRSSASRSDKGDFNNDTIGSTAINKRSRKKKTFAELREEENLLLKERIHLKKEISTVRVTLNEQKARSENFKKIKLDPHLDSAMKMATNSGQPTFSEACTLAHHVPVSPTIMHQDFPPMDSCKAEKEVETTERCFVLPDLNMIPSEEDSGCETLCGLS
ncbi:hypothetical protein RHGRI_005597 [Rhododendron griersonianum]|uniref:Uncharacterized protein n=1 Tax=Rhododendron griersonianum TaxID=479676 RepID=A0AAV6LDA0_9ERIC|nr:hypothetical protein RHGRI_005597 [Rhododendron griersonianum]